MLRKAELKTIEALHKLRITSEFKVFQDYLKSELDATHSRIVDTSNIEAIHELRGRAKLLIEVLYTVENTDLIREKLRR